MFITPVEFTAQQLQNAWGGFGNILMAVFILLLIFSDILRHADSLLVKRLGQRLQLMSWVMGFNVIGIVVLRILGFTV